MLVLGSFGDRLCMCDWLTGKNHYAVTARLERFLKAEFKKGTSEAIIKTSGELDEYFVGERRTFDVPLLFAGTEFQKQVWNALLEIPSGSTVTYGELAAGIGNPKAVRAVANAVGANAISIIAPCHRVIGSDGSLTGYAGGLEIKRALLKIEGIVK